MSEFMQDLMHFFVALLMGILGTLFVVAAGVALLRLAFSVMGP